MYIYTEIGNRIREVRKQASLSQEALAARIGVTANTISRWETGTYRIAIEDVYLLSLELDVPLSAFLPEETMENKDTEFTEREINEIKFCVMYAEEFSHGSDGHNRMRLIAKLAKLCTDESVRLIAGDEPILPAYQA